MNVSQVTNDILNNPRFEGAIDSISWMTDWIDVGFGMVITLVAFLIILVAMLKNVLAAAYCAYPKFWNSVHEAHETKRSNQNTNVFTQMLDMFQGVGSSRGGSINGGSIGQIIMGILPDIKSMTDFESDTLSPKNYFMKAIPQMLVCVILGAFIYNGTYRDVAARVVDFGSTMVERTLLSFDPIAAFDDFTGSAGRPVFASDGATRVEDQRVNKLATNMYTAIIGTYKDITTAEQKRVLADNCEGMATLVLDEAYNNSQMPTGLKTDETYSFALKLSWSSADRDTSAMIGKASSNPDVYQYASCIPISGLSVPTSETHESYIYLVAVMQFTKGQAVAANVGYNDMTLHLGNGVSANYNASIFMSPKEYAVTDGNNTVGTIKMDSSPSNRKITFEAATGASIDSSKSYNISGGITLRVQDKDGKLVTYTVTKLIPSGDGSLTAPESATAGTYPTSVNFGESVINPSRAEQQTPAPTADQG